MASKFLTAVSDDAGVRFCVLLDTDKSDDPAYTRNYDFGLAPTGWESADLNGTTYDAWSAYCAAEVKLLAAADLAALTGPADSTTLNVAGTTF